jgi:hypothetical protein
MLTCILFLVHRLTLDEGDLSKASAEISKDDYLFPMELSEPEEATKPASGRARAFINISATSAPPPA